MSILNTGPGPFPCLRRLACKYRSLADDLECISEGQHPDERKLRDAPLLLDWRVFIAPIPHLQGIVVGHPEIADGAMCRTSGLITFDPFAGYARTFSRFYRLGDRNA
ncbi:MULTISPECIES: DUF6634 family protein [Methylobacteriaceae]|uniref:DUF6634 family protein n=1 Tax=Methylobacteriaceae TaxID=119045 RepID=UPI00074F8CAE|nr:MULTISPECIES: DUF6634 family protein [Methylobacteriaceae]AMB44807.1 hypothetical protein Y590_07867 [Methylobacterium sp. AMS5]TFZ60892.1 hypothetical protein E4V01_03530 [Methylorubrum sp. Q1]